MYVWCSYDICLLRQSQVCNMFHRKLYWLGQDHRKVNSYRRVYLIAIYEQRHVVAEKNAPFFTARDVKQAHLF